MWPHSIALAGGSHATNIAHDIFLESSIDYLVRGEAENSMVQLLKLISDGELNKASSIQGVYFRDSISNEETLKISEYPDLNKLPTPCWHIFDMSHYTRTENKSETFAGRGMKKSCSIMTSRGCPFHCTFCSSFSLHGRKMVQNQVIEVSENFLRRYPDSSWDALERSDDQKYPPAISAVGARFSFQNPR